MNQFIQNLVGMGGMTEQVIATDFLIAAKESVRNYTIAITEAATPTVRSVLKEQLQDAIQTHENITNYMISKGYYHPHEIREQLQVDLTAAMTATDLAQKTNN
ncbi:spore coat protein [Bacillus sp. PS06]|uniref:spore coat protein n=1 Tax=Bacillus sp. PS06 TaxID=2764176 RepID=UPI0017876071|nr:spore coat protein [Bacillus sp. PS06]MBD8068700.1 spore coat protein [Bacillus sp. PS06]